MGRGKNVGGLSEKNKTDFQIEALKKGYSHNEMMGIMLKVYKKYHKEYEKYLKSKEKTDTQDEEEEEESED